MNPPHPATPAKRAPDVIADALMARIRHGELLPGTMLPTERELCEAFDASRPTVREAVARIQLMGFATTEAGRRPRAARPSLEGILRATGSTILGLLGEGQSAAHLEQMRQFIEVGAVRDATKKANTLQISRIKQALDDNFAAIGTPDFGKTDILFHRSIVSVTDNPVLLTVHDIFISRLIEQRPSLPDQNARDIRVYGEHRAVFQGLLEGDEVAATGSMDRHLARSYRERLAASEPANEP